MTLDYANWTCADTENRISDFLDGALAPEELAAFERHRSGCANCATLSARVGATVSGLHGMALLEEPPELVSAIMDRTSRARVAQKDVARVPTRQPADDRRPWFDWLSALAQPQFGYGALAVLVSAIVVSHALGIEWRRPTIADLQPASLYRAADSRGHIVFARGTKFVSDLRIVYEIQSALESEPALLSEPQPKPAPAPAPGQTKIAARFVTETAALMLGIGARKLP